MNTPDQSHRAREFQENGEVWNTSPGRRQFLKCMGGASAATVVGWHALQQQVMANGGNTKPGSSGGSGGSGS